MRKPPTLHHHSDSYPSDSNGAASASADPESDAAVSTLVMLAATKSAFLAQRLRESLAFLTEGQSWDSSRHGAQVQVDGQQLSSSHSDGNWQFARSQHAIRGPTDIYEMEVYWNNAVGGNETLGRVVTVARFRLLRSSFVH